MENTLSRVRDDAQPKQSLHQHLPAAAASALVLISAGLGAYAGWQFGIHSGVVIAFGLAAAAVAGEALKPFAVAATLEAAGRLEVFRMLACLAVALACIAYSVAGHVFLAMMARTDMSAHRIAEGRTLADARLDRERVLGELKAIGSPRTPAELKPLIASATRLGGNCLRIETATQREACKTLPQLQAEAARHDRKAQVEAALAAADRRIAAAGHVVEKVADPLAVAVSAYAKALGMQMPPDMVGPFLALIPVMLLEIGSMFAVVATRRTTVEVTAKAPNKTTLSVTTAQPIALPAPKASTEPHDGDVQAVNQTASVRAAADRIVAIAQERGGTLAASSKREVARLIDASPPTASRALAALTGVAAVSIDQTGIAVRLLG